MSDTDTPPPEAPEDKSITAIDGRLVPPGVERPSFQEELEFLAAASPDLPGPG